MHLTLLGLLLAGLLLQRTLHTLVRFASCHRSDCSVLTAGARSEILPSTHLEIAAAVKYELYLPPSLSFKGFIPILSNPILSNKMGLDLLLLLLGQLLIRCSLTAPTKNHAHKLMFNVCDLNHLIFAKL